MLVFQPTLHVFDITTKKFTTTGFSGTTTLSALCTFSNYYPIVLVGSQRVPEGVPQCWTRIHLKRCIRQDWRVDRSTLMFLLKTSFVEYRPVLALPQSHRAHHCIHAPTCNAFLSPARYSVKRRFQCRTKWQQTLNISQPQSLYFWSFVTLYK